MRALPAPAAVRYRRAVCPSLLARLADVPTVANGEHPCGRCAGRVLVLDAGAVLGCVRCQACGRKVAAICARKRRGQPCSCRLSGAPAGKREGRA